MQTNVSIKVNMLGMCIGELYWCPSVHNTLFSFSKSYFKNNLNVFPLIADKKFAITNNTFYGEANPIHKLLPSFLSESLPDSWEREYIVTQYKNSKRLSQETSPIEKLAYIRNRCLGALEYYIDDSLNYSNDLYWFNQIADEYEDYLREIRIPSLFRTDLETLCSFGTCSVGLRPKVLLALSKKTGEVRSGQIEQDNNYEHYILKIGETKNCIAEKEISYYQIALNAGIKMMPSYLINIDGGGHFITKRYDRANGCKIHTLSFAAMAPRSYSYEELFKVAVSLKLVREDIIELYRRLLFNIVTHNVDDHARNFSFIMDAKGNWSLAPAYDITYPITEHNIHSMTLNGKNERFRMDDILSIAYSYNILNHEDIYHQVLSSISNLNDILIKNGVSKKLSDNICKRVSGNIRYLQS